MHIRTIPDPGSFCGFIRFWMNAASHFARFRLVGYWEVGSHLPRMTPALSKLTGHLWKRRRCQAKKTTAPLSRGEGCQGRPQGVHLDPWQPSPCPIIELGTKRNEVQLSFVP